MRLNKKKISITTEEMCRIRHMGQVQMEQVLTDAMRLGYRQGYTDSEAETDVEFLLAEEDKAVEVRQALEENNRKWQKAVRNTITLTKGIRKRQRESLLEYLKDELERAGICRK